MKKTTTIIIRDDGYKERAAAIIKFLPFDPLHEVVIRPHNETTSSKQRRTYRMWVGQIAKELGTDKEDQHIYYKETYLKPIFERDDPEYSMMFDLVRDFYRDGQKDKALQIKNQIIKLTSTTHASVKQMWEYMTDVERDAASKRIALTYPEDLNRPKTKTE